MEVSKSLSSGRSGGSDMSFVRVFFACMVAGGIQYGWALQLSLLTPYVQTLGLSHTLSSIIWLCGPVAGFLVQPLVGYWSDRMRCAFGRRRPFILAGCLLICIAVILIAFSSDIGYKIGDTKEHCSIYRGPRWHAAMIYVAGFWILDFSNNAAQGPARALMADIAGHYGPDATNAIFCTWMAIGNILGYSAGATGKWHKWFPFLQTPACCEACANLKGAFLIAIIFLLFCMTVTMIFARETPLSEEDYERLEAEGSTGIFGVFSAFKHLPPGMLQVLLVTAITWLSWFPYFLYNTDWMGREVFHGNPQGTPAEAAMFETGVREGATALIFNSIVLAITSFLISPLCKKFGAKIVWAISNFMVVAAMIALVIVSKFSAKHSQLGAPENVKFAATAVIVFFGMPLAVLFSIPFAYAANMAISGGGGQGLCTGVLNISIVVPQVIIALGAGPWDALFGGGNVPAFALAAGFAFIGAILAVVLLPKVSKKAFTSSVSNAGH